MGYQGLKKHQLISVSYWLCPYLHVKKGIWKISIFRGNGHVPFRPVLLSTFLGNWRLRLRRWNAAGPNHADVCIPSKVDLQFHTKFICKTHSEMMFVWWYLTRVISECYFPFFKASAHRAGSFGPRGGSRSPSIATRFVEVLSSFFL